MERLERIIEDLGKFVVSMMALFFGYQNFSAEIAHVVNFSTLGAEMAMRAAMRLLDFNLVAYLRPVLTGLLVLGTVCLLVGIAPDIALSYDDEWQCTVLCALPSFFVMIWRRLLVVGISPIRVYISSERPALFAEDTQITAFGPNHRFDPYELIYFSAALIWLGCLLMVNALFIEHAYNTSPVFVWITAACGLCSMMAGLFTLKLLVWLFGGLVGSVGGWLETAAGRLARTILDPILLGIDDSNINDFFPKDVVGKVVGAIKLAERAYAIALIPILLLSAATFLSLSATLVIYAGIAFIGFALVYLAAICRGEDSLITDAKTRSLAGHRLFESAIFIGFMASTAQVAAYGLHAAPRHTRPIELITEAVSMIVGSFLLSVIASVVLFQLYKKGRDYKPLAGGWLTIPRLSAAGAMGILVIVTFAGYSYWRGIKPNIHADHWRRYEHTSDEALHCLNGMRDYDEVYTDIGPSCSRYRRVWNDPERLYSSPELVTFESVACGNPLQCFVRGVQDLWHGDAEHAQQRGLGNAPHNATASHMSAGMLASNDVTAKAFHPSQGGVSAPAGALSPYEGLIAEAVDQYPSIPHDYLRAVMYTESRFHTDVTSRMGAHGLMQFMPRTARHYGITDTGDPEQVVPAGAHYLSDLYDRAEGSQEDRLCLAAAGYNSGSGGMLAIMRGFSERQTLLQSCRSGNLAAYPRGDARFQKHRYAVTVMSRYRDYLNGIAPSAPSRGYRNYAVASRSSTEERDDVDDEVEPRQELAEADLSTNADACATMNERTLEIMRLRGRCP